MKNITDKIQKLLALSNSSNQHEAENALLKAQELLVKHKLELKDIKKDTTIEIIKEFSGITFTKAKWKISLANIIAKNFGCFSYMATHRTRHIMFMGTNEDVKIAISSFVFILDFMKKEIRKIQRIHKNYGYSSKGVESDYATGFILGLSEKFEEQKQKNKSSWGLVLLESKELLLEKEKMFPKDSKKKPYDPSMGYQGNNFALKSGYKDGKNFETNNLNKEVVQ